VFNYVNAIKERILNATFPEGGKPAQAYAGEDLTKEDLKK
jgi:hypothetical protein